MQAKRNKAFKERKRLQQIALAGRVPTEHCEICNELTLTVWDHDHKTGLFRGWLCDRCNRVLGSVNDSPNLLKKLSDYLEKSNGKINISGT